VPFSERAAADAFAARHGGRVAAFSEIPRTYVLGSGEAARAGPEPEPPTHKQAPSGKH
jgi:copper chaperone NosL